MAVIVQTRRAYLSYHDYDLDQWSNRDKLRNNINAIAREMNKTSNPDTKAYHKARLKFIAIKLCQLNQPKHGTVLDIWELLMKHIPAPTQDELRMNPEDLFEAPQGKSSPRKKTGYERNVTPALEASALKLQAKPTSAELSDGARLEGIVVSHRTDIKEHAARRVELFFLLSLALYKTKRTVMLAETSAQHGAATPGFQYAACHSALFTGINDKKTGVQTRTAQEEASILKGTYFAELLNTTVELPDAVNKFDSACEGRNGTTSRGLRKQLLPTLNKVSAGDLSPIDAMTVFFKAMTAFFNKEAKTHVKNTTHRVSVAAKETICEAQKSGTFYWADASQEKPSVGAVSAWLRSSPSAAGLFLLKPEFAEQVYARRQSEIFASKV